MAEGLYDLYNCVFDGSISGYQSPIERRPYHRNCGCAFHESRGSCPHQTSVQVSYPVRRSWSEGSLGLAMSCNTNINSSATNYAFGSTPAASF